MCIFQYPQYFQLLWDDPIDLDLQVEDGNICPYSWEDHTCDTGDGGQYCKSGDASTGGGEGEIYYLEPGSTSKQLLLYAIFWEYFMTPGTGNIRVAVNSGGQTINTISANWNEDLAIT